MTAFDEAFAHTVGLEGGYSNHPDDRGGETMFGITQAVARATGYDGAMKALPLATAKAIYKARYWDVLMLDSISAKSAALAAELFDTAVNMGTSKAGEMLQIALNALNDQGRLYGDVAEDGDVGAKTIAALAAYLVKRGKPGEAVLVRALNCLQGARYIEISRLRAANESFVYGWLATRVGV